MLIKNAPRREYRLKDGTLVPGVTTVLDVLNKPALLCWAWNGGWESRGKLTECQEGPTTFSGWQTQSRDSTAGVGTIAHYKIQCFLTAKKEEYGPGWEEEHIKMAQVPFESFLRWYEHHKVRPILVEHSSVHERDRYGGTFDLLAETTEGILVTDFKTSKAIYDEYLIQSSAYKRLLDQWPDYSRLRIREQVVLFPKDGGIDSTNHRSRTWPKARRTWRHLIKMYHHLTEFRKAA